MKSRGFTLIELLILAAIVAVISAVFLPLFFGKKHAMHDHRDSPDTVTIPATPVPATPASTAPPTPK